MVFTATAAILLDKEAFNQLVAEEDLKVWEVDGYIYTKKRGKSGIELYRTYGPKWRWLYTARRVATQANAAGGAIQIDITVASGMVAQLVHGRLVNSGTNTLQSYILDEDNAIGPTLVLIGNAAGNQSSLPADGSGVATLNTIQQRDLLIGPGQKLNVRQTGAGAQNDTLTVAIALLLPITAASDGSDISWSVAQSTNAGDVTLAASTISAANTMQAVLLP